MALPFSLQTQSGKPYLQGSRGPLEERENGSWLVSPWLAFLNKFEPVFYKALLLSLSDWPRSFWDSDNYIKLFLVYSFIMSDAQHSQNVFRGLCSSTGHGWVN